jgi:hypothetical protein
MNRCSGIDVLTSLYLCSGVPVPRRPSVGRGRFRRSLDSKSLARAWAQERGHVDGECCPPSDPRGGDQVGHGTHEPVVAVGSLTSRYENEGLAADSILLMDRNGLNSLFFARRLPPGTIQRVELYCDRVATTRSANQHRPRWTFASLAGLDYPWRFEPWQIPV